MFDPLVFVLPTDLYKSLIIRLVMLPYLSRLMLAVGTNLAPVGIFVAVG